ncbi:MAG: UvrD-helicase domain-containing protein [Acidobacteriota bacterium]
MPRIDFEQALNAEQLPAVTHGDGPQLVLAGAGSGKTRVITYRVAWLVQEHGIDPSKISAVTFTNKAAGEMKERIEELLGVYPLPAFVGTFHRFALRLLRAYGPKINLSRDFVILDGSDQQILIKKAMRAAELSSDAYRPQAVLSAISAAKNRLLGPSQFASRADDFFRQTVVAPVYRRYQAMLREAGGVDFDDMIMLSVKLLQSDSKLKQRIRARNRFLMVDEFQDTNHAQLMLIQQVSANLDVASGGNLTAVGDEDQGIYRWRGAELDNILEFERSFPGATIRKLERNYRSTQNILDASGAVVGNNVHRRGKRLWTDAGDGAKLRLFKARDEIDEARWAANLLQGFEGAYRTSEMAVLVRTNAQTRAFEDRFLRQGLAYQLVGGVRFYERSEIKDLLAYLRFVRNPQDNMSFERIVNRPPRGIGKKTLDGLLALAAENGQAAWDTLSEGELLGIPPRGAKALERFREQILPVIEAAQELPLPMVLDRLLEATAYTDLFDEKDEEGQMRLENIDEFRSGVQEFAESHGYGSTEEDLLTAFLDHVSLASDTDALKKQPGVTLTTLHSAKGLEFPVVVVAGLEEGVLPHFNAQELPENLEEERRLLYVGMTRAEKRLTLTTCSRRRVAGSYQDQEPSRFLLEVPERLVEVENSPELFASQRPSWNRPRPSWDQQTGRSSSAPSWALPKSSGTKSKLSDSDAVNSFFGRKSTADSSPPPAAAEPAPLAEAARSLTVVPVNEPTPAVRRLKRGTRVRHASLGTGRILNVEGSGEDMRLIVYFDSKGRKKLLAKYAQLEIL